MHHHTELAPTTREQAILLALAHTTIHGTITTTDMRALSLHGIHVLDLIDGLVPDPTALYLHGNLNHQWLIAALTRWAAPHHPHRPARPSHPLTPTRGQTTHHDPIPPHPGTPTPTTHPTPTPGEGAPQAPQAGEGGDPHGLHQRQITNINKRMETNTRNREA